MTEGMIGLKISTENASAKTIAIVRKYNGLPIVAVKKAIEERNYILLCSYIDQSGLQTIIKCYSELKENGIEAEVYELNEEITIIEFVINLNGMYDEIPEQLGRELDIQSICNEGIFVTEENIKFCLMVL